MAQDRQDGYGRSWDYRVFSSMWMEPDVQESGRRYLTVHRVDYQVGALSGTHDHPLPDDVIYIEVKPASPNGVEMEAALLDAERIMHAFNKPALIKAEWKKFFDHSEAQRRQWTKESDGLLDPS